MKNSYGALNDSRLPPKVLLMLLALLMLLIALLVSSSAPRCKRSTSRQDVTEDKP